MMKSAEGGTGHLHKITMPTVWRGGLQMLEKEQEDVKPSARCEEKRREWAQHWQGYTEVQDLQDKPWRNEELNRFGRRNAEVERK